MFVSSLRSRRLEVVGERENGRARGRHARGEGVSFSRARFFLCPLLPSACYAGYPGWDLSHFAKFGTFMGIL